MRNIFYVIVEKNERRRNIEMFITAKLQKQN